MNAILSGVAAVLFVAAAAALAVFWLGDVLASTGLLPLRGSARDRAAWQAAAELAGLRSIVPTAAGLEGRHLGLHVQLERYELGTRITVSGEALSPALSVRADKLRSWRARARETPTGDDGFDRLALVAGPCALARALLDADVRKALGALLEGQLRAPGRATFWASGELRNGVLRVDVPEAEPVATGEPGWFDKQADIASTDSGREGVAGPERMPEVLQRVLALAHRLETPRDVVAALASRLPTEPEPAVREQLLSTLLREAASAPATRQALLAAREDPDGRVRLRAATALGADGTDTLVQLADGEGADDSITRRAVEALGGGLGTDRALVILRGALRTRRVETALACLQCLAAHAGRAALHPLEQVLAVEGPALAAAAATALAQLSDLPADVATEREQALASALDHASPEVRRAAAVALGQVGGVPVVARLQEAEDEDPPVRAAARQAIALIQSRLAGAEPGQLSLAETEAGRLSMVHEGPGGELSLADGHAPPLRQPAATRAARQSPRAREA